jgi:hypothetical protein
MMNKRSSFSRTTSSTTVTAAIAILLVGTLAVIPFVEQAHALDLLDISDSAKSIAKAMHDIYGSRSTLPGHDNPH